MRKVRKLAWAQPGDGRADSMQMGPCSLLYFSCIRPRSWPRACIFEPWPEPNSAPGIGTGVWRYGAKETLGGLGKTQTWLPLNELPPFYRVQSTFINTASPPTNRELSDPVLATMPGRKAVLKG